MYYCLLYTSIVIIKRSITNLTITLITTDRITGTMGTMIDLTEQIIIIIRHRTTKIIIIEVPTTIIIRDQIIIIIGGIITSEVTKEEATEEITIIDPKYASYKQVTKPTRGGAIQDHEPTIRMIMGIHNEIIV